MQGILDVLADIPKWVPAGGVGAAVYCLFRYLEKLADNKARAVEGDHQQSQKEQQFDIEAFNAASAALQAIIASLNTEVAAKRQQVESISKALDDCQNERLGDRQKWIDAKANLDFEIRELQTKIGGYDFIRDGKLSPEQLRRMADDLEARRKPDDGA